MVKARLIALSSALVAFPLLAAAAETATAALKGPDGIEMGTVTLAEGSGGVLVQADVTGLAAGPHGFHIHETGACSPAFDAAGGHYNPAGAEHGLLFEGGHHAGDLPNIHAVSSGAAQADYFATGVTLAADAANTLFDADGSAIVIHENPDSYGKDAGAGGRVACGVITRN